MPLSNSRSKLWYTTIPLIIVSFLLLFELTLVLSTNQFSFLNMGMFSPHFSPSKYYAKLPNQNPDNTYTLVLNFSNLENVQQKGVLFAGYTALNLRPVQFSENQNLVSGNDVFEVDLPSNLKSSLPLNGSYIYPAELRNLVGKRISLQVMVNKLKPSYSAFDIVSWNLIYVE